MSRDGADEEHQQILGEVGTIFKHRILGVLVDGQARTGSEINNELEALYGEEVSAGRMYPSLDTLDEAHLIEKHQLGRSDRSNEYHITPLGRRVLQSEIEWFVGRFQECEFSTALDQTEVLANGD